MSRLRFSLFFSLLGQALGVTAYMALLYVNRFPENFLVAFRLILERALLILWPASSYLMAAEYMRKADAIGLFVILIAVNFVLYLAIGFCLSFALSGWKVLWRGADGIDVPRILR
jgi:hypothetical protein